MSHAGWSIRVAPKQGAAILNCMYEGLDILRPTPADWMNNPDMLRASYFPLAPYSNRIKDGTFQFNGREQSLTWDQSKRAHPLHGTAWQSDWQVTEHGQDHIRLMTRHTMRDDNWPWKFKLVHTLKVDTNGLHLSLSLTNEDTEAMPSGLGFHPYFANTKETELQFLADKVWLTNAENLPKALASIPDEWDFSTSKPIADTRLDNCFQNLQFPAYISWPKSRRRLRITGSPNLTHAVIYLDAETNSACFEPVTHMNNGLNWMHENVETGIQILNPGETHSADVRLKVENL